MNKLASYQSIISRTWMMIGLCVVLCANLLASDSIVQSSIFDLLSYEEVVKVSLEGDINHLRENKRSKKEVEATLSFKDKSGIQRNFKTDLTIRGKYRRMFSEGVPPLRLDFKKSDLEEAGLSTYDDMKMVTMFHEDKDEALQTLVKEYLVYKLYNQLTDYSYRVQLIEVEYKESTSGKTQKEYGFLIEDGAQFADRHGFTKIDDISQYDLSNVDQRQMEILAVFQYMIGNGDWKLETMRNLKLYERDGKIFPVPYDFDFCGMVDASYAVPNNIYNIKNVQERIYLGYVDSIDDLAEIIELFRSKKDAMTGITSNCRYLNKKNRKETTDYLKSFYDDITYRVTNNASMKDTLRTIQTGGQG